MATVAVAVYPCCFKMLRQRLFYREEQQLAGRQKLTCQVTLVRMGLSVHEGRERGFFCVLDSLWQTGRFLWKISPDKL